ncbi:MAG: fibrobacter succinogenes major paralogous domain-containing protein, partial [Bacteroidetes bacterium]|nr:fibrobacter succinogenes major paralogous domain-containing protein [Bacteroidota bacterium]
DFYGGLYQWGEMMQYTTTQGAQGICPPGWYLPTDEEWKQLEGEIDSEYGYPNPEWDLYDWRGYDVGTHIKSTIKWNNNGNGTDLFGFTCLPAGERCIPSGVFYALNHYSVLWSSSELSSFAWYRLPFKGAPKVCRGPETKLRGFSVRCLKD